MDGMQGSDHLKRVASTIANSPVLDDERKIAALENLAKGLYTDGEALMLSKFHITSTPLKLFFLGKSHRIYLSEDLTTKISPAFVCKEEPPDFVDDEKRVQQALKFQLAENTTHMRSSFWLPEGEGFLKVMWIDPMLMKISLEEHARDINRMLYQTDELERITWKREKRKALIAVPNRS